MGGRTDGHTKNTQLYDNDDKKFTTVFNNLFALMINLGAKMGPRIFNSGLFYFMVQIVKPYGKNKKWYLDGLHRLL